MTSQEKVTKKRFKAREKTLLEEIDLSNERSVVCEMK